jgi:hypothetical protein
LGLPNFLPVFRQRSSFTDEPCLERKPSDPNMEISKYMLADGLAERITLGVPFQVTFDSLDPDRLAKFWAQVLHYKEQDPPSGFGSWEEFLKAQGVPEQEWNSASAIVDPEKVGSRIYFQQVSERKSVKNRVHLDVNVTAGMKAPEEERRGRIFGEAERLIGLGAVKLNVFEESGEFWIVMADPEGNEFCLQ